MNLIEVGNRSEWRAWLAENHAKVNEAWLVYYKEEVGKRGVDYEASVEEALCFGWVDSIIKKIDESSYARKFTPRKDESKWSVVNKVRAEQLIDMGLMTEWGLAKIESARLSGAWDNPVGKPVLSIEMAPEFSSALQENPHARTQFEKLPMSHKKEYLIWINTAKRPETREKRIRESIQLLTDGKKLGLR